MIDIKTQFPHVHMFWDTCLSLATHVTSGISVWFYCLILSAVFHGYRVDNSVHCPVTVLSQVPSTQPHRQSVVQTVEELSHSFLLKYFNSSNTKLSLTFLHVILSAQSTSVLPHPTSSFFPISSCLRFYSGASISSSGALGVFVTLSLPSWIYL